MAAFANAVAETGQQVRLVVRDDLAEAQARALVSASCSRMRSRRALSMVQPEPKTVAAGLHSI